MNNTLAGKFKLVHQSLLKLKTYEWTYELYNVECKVSEINNITDTHKGTDGSNNSESSSRNALNKTSKTYIYWGTCGKDNKFGYLAKECKNIPSSTNQFDNNTPEQPW